MSSRYETRFAAAGLVLGAAVSLGLSAVAAPAAPAADGVAKTALIKTAPARATPMPPPPEAPSACIPTGTIAIDPAVAPLHLGTQSYPQTLALCDHEVVLTFDDGPWPQTTPRVLRALREAGVHATFFLIGRNTREHPELARQEMEEGHTVGHHSNTHPSFTLRAFDEASALADIESGIAEDERAIYGRAADPAHPHVPLFRFPGFADTPALLADLDRRGIAVFGSDLWAGDWIAMSPAHERQRIMDALERRPHHNGIILFHDTKASTAEMLPDLLRELKAGGYGVVDLVYARGAARPPLTAPLAGEPETQRIIAHLHVPIVPGSHHLPAKAEVIDHEPPGEGPL